MAKRVNRAARLRRNILGNVECMPETRELTF
jgi:hypothetical protein